MRYLWFFFLLPILAFARDPFSNVSAHPLNHALFIKARIVSVDRHYLQSLGLLFATSQPQIKSPDHLNMDTPTLRTGVGVAHIPVAKFSNGSTLDLQLNALQNEGHADIISSPELLVNNNEWAEISSGQEVPYQEKTGEGNTSVAFKKAVLRLKVKPTLLDNQHILLNIALNQDKVASLVVNGVPSIQTQQIKTNVSVQNQHTIVLGGIYETVNAKQGISIPILSRIPLLGRLFRNTEQQVEQKSLLIFITPEIMR